VRSSGNEDKEGEEVEDSIHLELDNKFEECSEIEVGTDEQGVVGKVSMSCMRLTVLVVLKVDHLILSFVVHNED
jgi:hypothetical protein